MKNVACFFLLILFGFWGLNFAQAQTSGVVISEVAFNPTGSDTGKEYVELFNPTPETVDISGWDVDPDGLPYFTIPSGTTIEPGGVLTIWLRTEGTNTSNSIYTGASFGSTNIRSSKGMVALFDATTHTQEHLVDYIQYGGSDETHETIAASAGKWQLGMYFSFLDQEGYSIQRTCVEHSVECFSLEQETPDDSLLRAVDGAKEHVILKVDDVAFEGQSLVLQTPAEVAFSLASGSGSLLYLEINGEPISIVENSYTFTPTEPGEYLFVYGISRNNTLGELSTFRYLWEEEVVDETSPLLTISEVFFLAGNDQNDFVEIFVGDTGSPETIQLEGYNIKIDNTIYDLSDLTVQTGDYIVLSLGKSTLSIPHTERIHLLEDKGSGGLVSTTEQIQLLNSNGELIAGVCWQGQTIPSTETTEHAFFTQYNPSIWDGDCISSVGLHSGQSVHLNQKDVQIGNRKEHYQVLPLPTPGDSNLILNEKPRPVISIQGDGKSTGFAPFSLNLTGELSSDDMALMSYVWDFGDSYVYEGINPPSHTYAVEGEYSISLTVTDKLGLQEKTYLLVSVTNAVKDSERGTSKVCDTTDDALKVQVNEVFPNPKGTDTGKEWIELYNPNDREVSLCGLYLDDMAGGSKPYSLRDTVIAARGLIVLRDSQTKLALGNSQDSVRLLKADQETVVYEVSYEDPPEEKSYSMFIP